MLVADKNGNLALAGACGALYSQLITQRRGGASYLRYAGAELLLDAINPQKVSKCIKLYTISIKFQPKPSFSGL